MSGYNAVLARNADNVPASSLSSHTVAFSHYNNLSAQLPVDINTGKLVAGGIKEQAEQCFKNIAAILQSIDHVMSDVVRITLFVRSIKDVDAALAVYKSFFPTYVPALTVTAVAALPLNALIQVDALITNGEGTIPNAPQAGDLIKLTNSASGALAAPLSTASVAFSHYNNLSAQLPIDPKTGRVVEGGIKAQTAQCLKNIKTILEGIDVPVDDVVKITVFLKNLTDIDAVNEVYTTCFPDTAIARAVGYFPARTVVAASALPMDALVQIEAVVAHGDGTPPQAVEDRHGIVIVARNTDSAPRCPYSTQTVAFSHYNHLSAQLPLDPHSGKLVAGGVKEQTAQCLKHIKTIVESIDHAMEDVVKVNIFLKNITDLDAVDAVYKAYFPQSAPARRVVGVAALPADALIQIDVVVANAEGTPPAAR